MPPGRRAVATPERHATDAAEAAFRDGGNAVDAALAAAITLAVTYPHNCGVGGDLFALVRRPGGTVACVNASGPAPRALDVEELRRRGDGMPASGPATITVPGAVAGWGRLHELGAALPWVGAFERAIRLAEDGVAVSRGLGRAIAGAGRVIEADAGLRAIFHPGGRPLAEDDPLRQPALARTLGTLAAAGSRALYEGDLAARLTTGLAASGSVLGPHDFERFAPEEPAPLRGRFGDLTILTAPPNSAGVLLLQALAAIETAGIAESALCDDAGLLAEVLRLGMGQRDLELADPALAPFEPAAWLGDARIGELVRRAAAAARGRRREPGRAAARGDGDTAAVATADASGTAVSLIQSLASSFGAGILEPSTGVLLHNRGSAFALEPGHPNVLAPGKRPAHTLMPVMAERGGDLVVAQGTMGGLAHAQIHVQVLLRLLSGAAPGDAVAAPRFIVSGIAPGRPDDVVWVEDGVPAAARRSLRRAGMRIRELPAHSASTGHAQVVARDAGGALHSGTDPRADG